MAVGLLLLFHFSEFTSGVVDAGFKSPLLAFGYCIELLGTPEGADDRQTRRSLDGARGTIVQNTFDHSHACRSGHWRW